VVPLIPLRWNARCHEDLVVPSESLCGEFVELVIESFDVARAEVHTLPLPFLDLSEDVLLGPAGMWSLHNFGQNARPPLKTSFSDAPVSQAELEELLSDPEVARVVQILQEMRSKE